MSHDALFQANPDIDQTVLQFIDVIHFSLLLCTSPQILTSQIWTIGYTSVRCFPSKKADCLTCWCFVLLRVSNELTRTGIFLEIRKWG